MTQQQFQKAINDLFSTHVHTCRPIKNGHSYYLQVEGVGISYQLPLHSTTYTDLEIAMYGNSENEIDYQAAYNIIWDLI